MARLLTLRMMLVTLYFAISTASAQAEAGCVDAEMAVPPYYYPQCTETDNYTLPANWRTVSDYTAFPDLVTTRFVDQGSGETLDISLEPGKNDVILYFAQVRMECYSPSDENREAKVCTAEDVDAPFDIGGPYVFSNLSEFGILPGWTCEIVGCFLDNFEYQYYRTPLDVYTIPKAEVVATTSLPTVTTLHTTAHSTRATTSPISEDTSPGEATTVYGGNDTTTGVEIHFDGHLYVYVITVTLTVVVFAVVLLPLLAVVLCRRQSRFRKNILLTYNKDNMVFDPDFYPAVIIEKQTMFSWTGASTMSLDLLQNLNQKRQSNFYVQDGLTNEDKLSFENKEKCDDNSTVDGTSIVAKAVGTGTMDDTASLRTLTITDHGYVSSSGRYGGGSKLNDLENGYQLEAGVSVQSMHCKTVVQTSDCKALNEDNTSCLTESMDPGDQIGRTPNSSVECSHPSSEYVHPTCSSPSSREPALTSEFEALSVDLDLDFLDETLSCKSMSLGTSSGEDRCLSGTMAPPLRDSDEANQNNIIMHRVASCTHSRRDFPDKNATANDLIELDDPYFRAANTSYIFLNPPSGMRAEREEETLAEKHSNFDGGSPGYIELPTFTCAAPSNSCSTGTSGTTVIKTDSQSMTGFGAMGMHKYIPSEELTRTILVPPCAVLAPDIENGFTVHLDFNDRYDRETTS